MLVVVESIAEQWLYRGCSGYCRCIATLVLVFQKNVSGECPACDDDDQEAKHQDNQAEFGPVFLLRRLIIACGGVTIQATALKSVVCGRL